MTHDIDVQHIPASHPYTVRIGASRPDPPVPGAPPGQWWPHPALTPEWVEDPGGGSGVQVVHVHFGFEHRTPTQLRAWVNALDRAGKPLVVTVHDLENPHLAVPSDPVERSAYDELLDVLVPAAAALTTLTDGAARVIERRWGRAALVHPHPHLVDEDWLDRARPEHEGWIVTVHLKSLRANVDLDVVSAVLREVGRIPGARLRLHVHADVLEPDHPRHDPRLLELVSHTPAAPALDLRVHGPLGDAELWADLLDSDLAVLPYRAGTHSGWLEMCHDLGTPVLAPDVGHFADQRPIRTWRTGHAGVSTGSTATALRASLQAAHGDFGAGCRQVRPSAAQRVTEREVVARLHGELYASILSQARARDRSPLIHPSGASR